MKIEVATKIVEAMNDMGIEANVSEDYSGRGMYGRKTAGIIIDGWGDILKGVAAAAIKIGEAANEREMEHNGEPVMDPAEFIDEVGDIRTDNMGRSIIVY